MTATEEEKRPEKLPRPIRRRIVSALLGLAILCSGIVIGSGITIYAVSHYIVEGLRNPDLLPERMAARLQRQLELTGEQEAEILAIFNARKKQIGEYRARIQPRLEKELEAVRAEVEAVLTPEQAKKWNTRFKRMESIILPGNKETE